MRRKILILWFITLCVTVYGQKHLNKIEAEPAITKFNINNISTYIYGDGRADVNGGDSGFEFPKGANRFCFYESGVIWGGYDEANVLKIGGSTFPSSMVEGKIGDDPQNARVYRVRPDWETCSLDSEIEDGEFGGDEDEIRKQYKQDWYEWPWQDGAPYTDVDGNGIYEPDPNRNGRYDFDEDIPGIPGAAQTLFYVANNANYDKARQFYGSEPTSFEMRVTIWGYSTFEILSNMLFKKYEIVNKDDQAYHDLYFGIWCDPDVGGAGDDYVGCDTLLNLGYAYNADDDDRQYGNDIPACGHVLLDFQGEREKLASFYYFVNGPHNPWNFSSPDVQQVYNSLLGLNMRSGTPDSLPNVLGGGITRYPLSGDPVTGEGYIDGMVMDPYDRRYQLNIGPIDIGVNETISFTFAQIAAKGSNRLTSVSKLKEYAEYAIDISGNNCCMPTSPIPPLLHSYEGDEEIILHWGDMERVKLIEDANYDDLYFQGYNVYQLTSPDLSSVEKIKIATYDIEDDIYIIYRTEIDEYGNETKVVDQYGPNNGIERYIRITHDKFHNSRLINGSDYYFAVTAYNYSDDFWKANQSLESHIQIITVTPNSGTPGVNYEYGFGFNPVIEHVTGVSDADIEVMVVDPSRLRSSEYQIEFTQEDETLKWAIRNLTTDTTYVEKGSIPETNDRYYIFDGFKLSIHDFNNTLSVSDEYRFSIRGQQFVVDGAREEIEKINVFPNPYYGANPNELNKYQRFVTFSHLPEQATIRIFNLAGQLIKTIYKTEPGQFQRWDLMNDHNFLVPGGIYLAYIEMPELGETKVLKLAVVTENIVPDYY